MLYIEGKQDLPNQQGRQLTNLIRILRDSLPHPSYLCLTLQQPVYELRGAQNLKFLSPQFGIF